MTCPPSELSPILMSPPEYSQQERTLLLQLAHDVIESGLIGKSISTEPPTPHLAEPRGAFTTLHIQGKLRGCVGYVVPLYPLYRTVAETAVAAALQDDRFPPVIRAEVPLVQIEISILSPMKP